MTDDNLKALVEQHLTGEPATTAEPAGDAPLALNSPGLESSLRAALGIHPNH